MNKVLGNKKSIAVFVLPAFLIYAVFVLVPIGYNVYVSFFADGSDESEQVCGV